MHFYEQMQVETVGGKNAVFTSFWLWENKN